MRIRSMMPATPLPELTRHDDEAIRSVTGATHLAASFRQRLAAARDRINAVGDSMSEAMSELERTTQHAEQLARDVEREAEELQRSLSSFTNGPEE